MSVQTSIVIVNFNGRDKLARMLDGLKVEQAITGGGEVIVVDNASFDGSAEMVVERFGGRVKLNRNSANRGFASGANAGIKQAVGDVIVLCHADLVTTMTDLTELADQLREARSRRVAAMLPRLVGADGKPQPMVARLPKLSTGVAGALGAARLARRGAVPALDHVADHEYATLACCAVDADVIASLGGLDPAFFVYFADADFCARMHDKAHRILISRTLAVTHTGSALGSPLPEHLRRMMRKDLARFFQKQRPAWEQTVIGWADSTRKLVTRAAE